ncbi:hypothetical protein H476_2694 [[Clostridium] sordellii VPI 9048]|nr:hypothetical protein H476_2694 [[Clostridium] sordellii VPI 9048] [Paeniclostridium sordellii VPI 9048]
MIYLYTSISILLMQYLFLKFYNKLQIFLQFIINKKYIKHTLVIY